MGVDPIAARSLSFWEYTALRATWNERHKPEGGGDDIAPPSPDKNERMFAKTRMN